MADSQRICLEFLVATPESQKMSMPLDTIPLLFVTLFFQNLFQVVSKSKLINLLMFTIPVEDNAKAYVAPIQKTRLHPKTNRKSRDQSLPDIAFKK